jgi:pterin-4a-carbinolamine dehydratase
MQKNGGYNLEHKYSRSTFCCYKNYYQCLQIAHMINQLAEQSNHIADMFEAHKKFTLKHIWKDLISVLKIGVIEEKDFVINARIQVRLAG